MPIRMTSVSVVAIELFYKQKAPRMWGYSAMLETESVLSCLFLVWDNAAPKVMPVRLVLFWVI